MTNIKWIILTWDYQYLSRCCDILYQYRKIPSEYHDVYIFSPISLSPYGDYGISNSPCDGWYWRAKGGTVQQGRAVSDDLVHIVGRGQNPRLLG